MSYETFNGRKLQKKSFVSTNDDLLSTSIHRKTYICYWII